MKFRLKELRTKLDLTQREMAAKLKISKSYYNYFETGERIIPIPRLNDYCNTFKLSADYVLGLENSYETPKKTYTIDINIIGKRLKETRKLRNLTQKDIASLINTSQSTVSSYEHGRTMILTELLYDICTKLDVSADYIMGRSDNPERINKTTLV